MQSRKEKAVELFKEGYNCSQAVFAAFADIYDMDEKTALKVASSFGGGMGRMREVCGTVSGMFLVAGLETGATEGKDAEGKKLNYDMVQKLANEFKKRNHSIICRELLGLDKSKDETLTQGTTPQERTEQYYQKRPCADLVADAADILEQILFHSQEEENFNQ